MTWLDLWCKKLRALPAVFLEYKHWEKKNLVLLDEDGKITD